MTDNYVSFFWTAFFFTPFTGVPWFKSLTKFLGRKYAGQLRIISDHTHLEHVVILSDQYLDMATVASFDLQKSYAEFNVINRYTEVGSMLAHIKRASSDLAEAIFGDVLFHFWYEQFRY